MEADLLRCPRHGDRPLAEFKRLAPAVAPANGKGGPVQVWRHATRGCGCWVYVCREIEQRKVTARFNALANWWHATTDAGSSPDEKANHPAYREIVDELGWLAVRFILEDLRDRGGQWYAALEEITGMVPPLPPGTPYSLRAEHDAWLAWGRAYGYLP